MTTIGHSLDVPFRPPSSSKRPRENPRLLVRAVPGVVRKEGAGRGTEEGPQRQLPPKPNPQPRPRGRWLAWPGRTEGDRTHHTTHRAIIAERLGPSAPTSAKVAAHTCGLRGRPPGPRPHSLVRGWGRSGVRCGAGGREGLTGNCSCSVRLPLLPSPAREALGPGVVGAPGRGRRTNAPTP